MNSVNTEFLKICLCKLVLALIRQVRLKFYMKRFLLRSLLLWFAYKRFSLFYWWLAWSLLFSVGRSLNYQQEKDPSVRISEVQRGQTLRRRMPVQWLPFTCLDACRCPYFWSVDRYVCWSLTKTPVGTPNFKDIRRISDEVFEKLAL